MKDTKHLMIYACMLCMLILSSCTSVIEPAEYIRFVNNPENGLHKKKSVSNITMDVQYKPISYVIANEFRKNNISKSNFDDRYNDLVGAQYYTMRLAVEGDAGQDVINYKVVNQSQQQDRLYYLSFAMKHDIKLVDGLDTLRPILYHFERSYDLGKERTFVMAFEQKEENFSKEKTFILDSGMFETGPLKVKFKEPDLLNIPTMKLQP